MALPTASGPQKVDQSSEASAERAVPPVETSSIEVDALNVRLLLICQGEGMQSRYMELADENSGLTAVGWEQVETLAAWLREYEEVDVVWCFPQLASWLTAQRVGQALQLPVHIQRRFVPGDSAADGPLMELLAAQNGRSIVLIIDGASLRAIVRYLLRTPQLYLQISHTGIVELESRDGDWHLIYANRHEHMPTPPLAPSEVDSEPLYDSESNEQLDVVIATYNRVAAASQAENDPYRRQRIDHLLGFASLPSGARVIDIGTGDGLMALAAIEAGASEVMGVDVSPRMLERAEYLRLRSESESAHKVSFHLAPSQQLPFADKFFDAAICRLLLHHIYNPERTMREAWRVLKPGGVLVLADLLSADDPVKRATQNAIEERRNPSHVAARSAEQYRHLLTESGFAIQEEAIVYFERELEEWLSDLEADAASRSVVREMVLAGLETDAAGTNARRVREALVFDQRLMYIRAVKA